MEDRFTPTLNDILLLARDEAVYFGNLEIHNEHLLLGILDDYLLNQHENAAVRYLKSVANLEFIKAELVKLCDGFEKYEGLVPDTIKYEKLTSKVIKITYLESKILRANAIGSPMLLLSILRDDDSKLADMLYGRFKIDYDSVKQAIESSPQSFLEDGLTEILPRRPSPPTNVSATIVIGDEHVSTASDMTTPLSLYFNMLDYTPEKVKEIVLMLSEVYHEVSGDTLKVSGHGQYTIVNELECI